MEYGSIFLCIEAEAVPETSLPSYPTTHCNIPDDCPVYQYGNVNLKSRFCKPDELNFCSIKKEIAGPSDRAV